MLEAAVETSISFAGQTTFSKHDLEYLASSRQSEFPRLPQSPMLMIDRITRIDPAGGQFGRGLIKAELDIHPELWFFKCHFADDPVMPGSLGVDGLCQVLGFYLGWQGMQGKGRALSLNNVRYHNPVVPASSIVTYEVEVIKPFKTTALSGCVANGRLCVGDLAATTVEKFRVGVQEV
ncbi:MAG: bifunctional 3-hydroxydecanoyl-ACP dehydratase/trans-2-decenoyl-ACP isomerase [Pseudomonadota bacterium]